MEVWNQAEQQRSDYNENVGDPFTYKTPKKIVDFPYKPATMKRIYQA